MYSTQDPPYVERRNSLAFYQFDQIDNFIACEQIKSNCEKIEYTFVFISLAFVVGTFVAMYLNWLVAKGVIFYTGLLPAVAIMAAACVFAPKVGKMLTPFRYVWDLAHRFSDIASHYRIQGQKAELRRKELLLNLTKAMQEGYKENLQKRTAH